MAFSQVSEEASHLFARIDKSEPSLDIRAISLLGYRKAKLRA
jgi:hypothetical protein